VGPEKGVALLTWALPSVTAQDAQKKEDLEERVAALEDLLKHFSRTGNEVTIKGGNLHIINGLGETPTTNSLGNLIVGYNEPREGAENTRTGSHNVVVPGDRAGQDSDHAVRPANGRCASRVAR
jgi:hypothetical protein